MRAYDPAIEERREEENMSEAPESTEVEVETVTEDEASNDAVEADAEAEAANDATDPE